MVLMILTKHDNCEYTFYNLIIDKNNDDITIVIMIVMTLILKMKKFFYTIHQEQDGDYLNYDKYEYEKASMFLMVTMMMMMVGSDKENCKCSYGKLCLILMVTIKTDDNSSYRA